MISIKWGIKLEEISSHPTLIIKRYTNCKHRNEMFYVSLGKKVVKSIKVLFRVNLRKGENENQFEPVQMEDSTELSTSIRWDNGELKPK